MSITEHYRMGVLSVRNAGTNGFVVMHDHGSERSPQPGPTIVPPRTPGSRHPLHVGQEMPYGWNFRTKTGARRYMEAVSAAQILPEDRPATMQEVRNLRDWIEAEASA